MRVHTEWNFHVCALLYPYSPSLCCWYCHNRHGAWQHSSCDCRRSIFSSLLPFGCRCPFANVVHILLPLKIQPGHSQHQFRLCRDMHSEQGCTVGVDSFRSCLTGVEENKILSTQTLVQIPIADPKRGAWVMPNFKKVP